MVYAPRGYRGLTIIYILSRTTSKLVREREGESREKNVLLLSNNLVQQTSIGWNRKN